MRYSRYECTQLTKIGTSVLIYVSSSSIVQPDAGWSPRRRQARQHPGPEDGFIHYQLLRFCQATRLQYLNGHITLADQNVLHWAPLPVVFAMLKRSPRPAQQVWLPDNDLQGPTSWDARPLCTLMRLHEDLLRNFDCTDQPVAPQPPPASGAGGGAAGVRLRWAHTRSLGTQAPRTAATASWFSRNSTASTGIQAEPDSLLGVFKLSRPAAQPAHPHSHATPSHAAIDQALGPLQGPASAICRHALRRAAPASPPPETLSE